MLRCGNGLVLVMLALGSGASAVKADETLAARQYGAGVHDYFQGRYHEAIERFDRAVNDSGRDPRVYYFRGLAKQRLGWNDDARTDFLIGSRLEVALKRHDVGMALQRVQGPDRMALEQYRREARLLPESMVRGVVPPPSAASVPMPGATRPQRTTGGGVAAVELSVDNSDPFREGAPGLLGRGEIEAVPDQAGGVAKQSPARGAAVVPAGDLGADAQPFGSGVVSESDQQDPFAVDEAGVAAGGTAEPEAAEAAAGGAAKSGGALGAVLRAFSRSIVPAETTSKQGGQVLEGMRGNGPPQPPNENTDPFAEPQQDPQPAPANETEDPFVDDDDPFKL